jgi:hypothetical protein
MTKKKLRQIIKEEARKLVSEKVVPGQPYSPPQDPRLKYAYPPMNKLKAALDELLGNPIIRYRVKHVDEDGSVNSPTGAGLKYNVDITVLDEGEPNIDENRKGNKVMKKRQLMRIIKEEANKLLKEKNLEKEIRRRLEAIYQDYKKARHPIGRRGHADFGEFLEQYIETRDGSDMKTELLNQVGYADDRAAIAKMSEQDIFRMVKTTFDGTIAGTMRSIKDYEPQIRAPEPKYINEFVKEVVKEEVSKLLKEQEAGEFEPNVSPFRSGEMNADEIERFRSKDAKRRRALARIKPRDAQGRLTGHEFNPEPGNPQYAKTDRELDTMVDDMDSLSVVNMGFDADIAQADREAAAQYFDDDQKSHHMADRFKNQGEGPTRASAREQAAKDKIKAKYARKIALAQKELQRAQDANASEPEIDRLKTALAYLQGEMQDDIKRLKSQRKF